MSLSGPGRIALLPLLLLGWLGAASGTTIGGRFHEDPGFKLYSVIFEITPKSDGTPETVKVAGVLDPRSGSKAMIQLDLPPTFVTRAEEMIRAQKREPRTGENSTKPFYTYFYYAPQLGDRPIDDLDAEMPEPIVLNRKGPVDQPQGIEHGKVESFDQAIAPYVEKARAAFPEVRQRYLAGLPSDQKLFVTTRLHDKDQKWEQVFIGVTGIEGNQISGVISSDLTTVKEFKTGARYSFPDSDLLDWTIIHPRGVEEGNFVGKFLDTYRP